MKKRLAIIPARGGSKGIPKKNIYPVAGHPLIYYSIQAAKEAEQAQQEEEPEEEPQPEGTLTDPQTGEQVTMPDPETIDQNDDSVLGDTPVNDNLVNHGEEPPEDNPTE